ncbi:MAG TPA: PKD domain-containing protein [Bacteroidetes bacterium]|nr:PKD domain-containing protein [Bacteroidota bacterium]
MTNKTYIQALLTIFLFCQSQHFAQAQVNYTANDQVTPYDGYFHPSANIGEYTSFSEKTLAELAAGNPAINVPGVGVKALRPGLFEDFLENAGYSASVTTFEFYKSLGMDDHTVIVGFPSPEHQETEQFCPGFRSELFANLYEPIWDNGENGTPINEDNYYALYLWKTVSQYKDYVRFWEIWNEPGFDFTGGLGFLPPGAPGNWWDNNPSPCDYKLRAPIFHYIRLLRISWEVIKSLDPEAYVVVSGTGFPSFLDAILRNTDNPDDGSVTGDFPKKGGAYFDVMGYHSYPHFDGSLREWSDELNDWVYSRHSDGAADGILRTKNMFQDVLSNYGYDGATYPEKLWMITEVNLPRKEFDEFIGSAEAQRNFMIKAVVTSMMNDILQLHIFKLAEDTYFDNAYSEFDLMGLYKRLEYNDLYFQEMNEEGIAHKTASDILYKKTFDADRTLALDLADEIGGGAFTDEHGNYTYVLWAKTQIDSSEEASAVYSFPSNLGISNLVKCEWDAGVSHVADNIGPDNIPLTATPVFLTETQFLMNAYSGCAPFQLELQNQVQQAVNWTWTASKNGQAVATSDEANPSFFFATKGDYEIEMKAFNGNGQLIAQQAQTIVVNAVPAPEFEMEISGPIVHFQNLTEFGSNDFVWDFGDGTMSSDPVPSHVYLTSGEFTATLTVSNECGSQSVSTQVNAVSPQTTQLTFTANEQVPVFNGKFRPGTSWDFVNGWTDGQLSDLAGGNILQEVEGIGAKAFRTYIGEAFFLGQGYESKVSLFEHYRNIGLEDNTFLLAFPSPDSRDPYFFCPEQQSAMFKDLYLEIWDNGENGTPINDENPFALYVYNTVNTYKDFVKFWEIYNSPDFDLTGDRAWLPPGEPGNWWENNPDPCEYELRAPIFYYVRSLRIAYEIIRYLDEDSYVTISGLGFPSFLDAVCRNTDNPVDGSTSDPYPLRGGAYFDAVGYKSYPHFDGSTIYFDPEIGNFAYERHTDAAVSGIARVKQEFQDVLDRYGYNGAEFPKKEFIISEANIPRRQLSFYLGGEEAQVNWTIKAWVESVKNDIRQLNFFRLAESNFSWLATDPFEVMGFYQVMNGVAPYEQVVNKQGMALKTCSDLLFGTDYNQQRTEEMMLPDSLDGAAFQDAEGNYIYILWAKTDTDFDENASAVFSFPSSMGIAELHRFKWDYSQTGTSETIASANIELTGEPIFLTEVAATLMSPIAAFVADNESGCVGDFISFSSLAMGSPANYEWSFPGGVPDAHFGETPPAISYTQPGVFDVSLTVSNAAGGHTATYRNFIEIKPLPVADFDFEINGSTVVFNNLSENASNYEWCYGDGFCDIAETPTYTYFQNGEFTVTLTAWSDCDTSVFEQIISLNAAPTAVFDFQYTGNCNIPQAILLDNSFSNPETWQWSIPLGDPSSSDLRYPTVNFPFGGTFEVTLITGNSFGFDTLTQLIYIEGNSAHETDVSLCAGSFYNGVQVFLDTTITAEFTTQILGCDSTVTAHISVTDQVEISQLLEFCEGDIYHGVVLNQDTVLVETINSQTGCDTLLTSNITVLPNAETFLVKEINEGEILIIGDQVFDSTGQYEILLQAANGCDSLVHLDLSVLTGIEEVRKGQIELKAFPNPFSNSLNLHFYLPKNENVSIGLFDVNGRLVRSFLKNKWLSAGEHRFVWSRDWSSAGVFWVKVTTEDGVFARKVVGM